MSSSNVQTWREAGDKITTQRHERSIATIGSARVLLVRNVCIRTWSKMAYLHKLAETLLSCCGKGRSYRRSHLKLEEDITLINNASGFGGEGACACDQSRPQRTEASLPILAQGQLVFTTFSTEVLHQKNLPPGPGCSKAG